MGKGLGADCIIVGSVAALGCPLYITARMVNVEKGAILHSAKMKLDFWSEYEQKLPAFASEFVRKMPTPNYFTGVWTGTVSDGTYSYARDEFSGGWMFKLQAVFRGAKIPRLRKINWAYPINLNNGKNSFSLNFPLNSQQIVRLTLTKEE